MTTQEVAVVGETQRFECQVIGFPTPTITWYKDEVDITHNPRYNISFDEDLGIITLMIKNVSLADEGCYVCRAENSEGFATTTAYLVVRVERESGAKKDFAAMTIEKVTEEELSQVEVIKAGRSTIIEEVVTHIEETEKEVFEEKTVAPKITYEARLKEKLSFKEGATVYLEVNFTGYPQPQVTWYQNDNEISESASITMETMDGWSYLKVKGTTSKDSGIYKVVAENVAGRDSAEFPVVIKSPPSSPRNLHVVEVYKDYIIIAWDEPEHTGGDSILGYQVEKTLSGDKFVTAGYADADTTRFKVTKLFEGTDYLFRVTAENKVGFGPPATLDKPVKARLPFDPPSCPRNLRVTETNKDYITVAWDKPENSGGSDIIQYIIEKRDATRGGSMWIVAGTVDADEFSFRCTKLFQGNKYLFRVTAENRVGPGEAAELSEPVIAKLPYDKPMPPRNLHAVETNRDYIVIAWEAPESDGGAPITNYVLEKHDAKHPGYIYMADVDADTFQYKATRLFEGYEYYFQVIAENQVGPSDPCETKKPIKAKLPFDEPDRPNNLRVKEYWTDYITVTWDAPANDGGSPITGYIIEKRDVSRQNWIKAGTVGPDVTTFKVSNLFEGAKYLIRVFAENKVGPSKEAAELDTPCKAKMPFDPPFAPRNLKVIDFNTDYITISWQPPENDGGAPIKGYVVEKHDTHMPMWMQAATLDKDTLSYKVENLFEGQSYEFRVAAENECGRGHYVETDKPTQARLPYNKPSPPRGLRVTDVWKDYISLLWEEPESDGGSPLTGYTIEQRDAYEATYRFVVALGADATTYQVTNLNEGHEYYFRVFSQNAAGLSEKPAEIKPPVKAKLPFEIPLPPRNVRCTGTGSGSISIAWEAPESDGGSAITHYHVETCRTTQMNYNRVATVDATTTTFDITGLVDGADYYVRVYAENKAGESKRPCELDEPVKAMKPIYKPGPPVNLRVLDTNKDHITIAWDAPENDGGAEITNYIIESQSDLDRSYVPIAKVDGVITKYTARGLLEGSDYNFRVKARNAAGVSDEGIQLTKPVTAKLPFDPPAAPRNLRVTSVNRYEISLAWDVPEFDGGSKLTGFTVEMKSLLDKKYRCLRTLDETATSYTAVGLTEGTEYFFRIRAKNDAGIGEPVELKEPVTARAPYDVPKEPKNLEVTNVDDSSVTISWQTPESDGGSAIINYIIEMRSAKETKYKVIGKVSADTLSYTATDLKEGSKYTFRVKSENIAGVSDACKLDKPVKVEAKLVPPNCPTNLTVSDANKDRVTLIWSAPEMNKTNPIGSYVIEMKAPGDVDFVPVGKVDGKKTTYTVKKLDAGEKYEFRVRAKNEAGLSAGGAELVEPLTIQTAKEQKRAKEENKEVKSSEDDEKESEKKEAKAKKAKDEPKTEEPEEAKVKEEKPKKAEPKKKEAKKEKAKEEKPEKVEPAEEELKKTEPKKKEQKKEESKEEEPKKEPKKKEAKKEEVKEEKQKVEEPKVKPKEEETKKLEPSEADEEKEEMARLPSAPVDLTVESVSEDSVTVRWSPSLSDGGSAILHYIIVMRESTKKKFKKVGKVAGNTLQYSITSNIEPTKEYFIRVYAENSIGISESAAEIESAIKIPAKVTEKVEMEEEIVEEKVMTVESKVTEGEAPQQEPEVISEAETAPKPEEAPEEVISDKQEKVATEKPQTVPSAPRNLVVKDVTSSSVMLSWEAPEDIGNAALTSYLVVMREADKNKFKKVGQTDGNTLNLVITKVKEGREYFFRLYAENKVGISEEMAELEQSVKIPSKEPVEEQTSAVTEESKQEPVQDQPDAAASGAPVITVKPEPITVKEGETIRLTCQVTGKPDPTVTWYKDEKKIKPKKEGRVKVDWDAASDLNILTISSATVEDCGNYTVKATNDCGTECCTVSVSVSSVNETGRIEKTDTEVTEASEEVKVDKIEVEFNTTEEETTEAESEIVDTEVTLSEEESSETESSEAECEGEDVEKKKKKKKKLIVKMKEEVDVSAKKIRKTKKEKGGEKMTGEQEREEERKSKKEEEKAVPLEKKEMQSVEQPEVKLSKPVFSVTPEPVIVSEGERVKLSCRVTGKPDPTVTWYKDEKKIKPKKEGRVKVDWDAASDLNILTISSATVEDCGNYTVKATNDCGTECCTVSVSVSSVSEPGRIEKTDIEVTEASGEVKVDKVEVEFNTTEEETTEAESEIVDTEITLSEEESSETESSEAECEGEDVEKKKKKKKKLIVKMKEEVDVSAKKIRKTKKEKSKESGTKEKSEEKDTETETEMEEKPLGKDTKPKELEMNLEPKEALQELPVIEQSEKVEDLLKPRFEMIPEPVTVKEGETVKLSCKVAGDPQPTVTWYKGNKQLKPKKLDQHIEIHWDLLSDLYTLVIKECTIDDADDYTIKASNIHGEVSATVTVTVIVEDKDKDKQDIITISYTDQNTQLENGNADDAGIAEVAIVQEEAARALKISADKDLNIGIDITDTKELLEEMGSKESTGKPQLILVTSKKDADAKETPTSVDRPAQGDTLDASQKGKGDKKVKENLEKSNEKVEQSSPMDTNEMEEKVKGDKKKDSDVHKIKDTIAKDEKKEKVVAEKQDKMATKKAKEGDAVGTESMMEETAVLNEKQVEKGKITVEENKDLRSETTVKKETIIIEETIYSAVDVDSEAFGDITLEEVVTNKSVSLPQFELFPEPAVVKAGATVTLGARILGQPKPDVSWYKGSKQFEKSEGRVTLDYNSSDDVHLLIIKETSPEDAGQYTVVASNNGGTVSATVNVAISVPEEVKVVEEEVSETTEQKPKEEKSKEEEVEKPKEKKPDEDKSKDEKSKEEKLNEEESKEEKPTKEEQKEEKLAEVEETVEKVEETPKEKKPKEKKKKKDVVEEKIEEEEEQKTEDKPKEEKKKKKEKKEDVKEEEVPKEKKEKKKKEKEKEEKPKEDEKPAEQEVKEEKPKEEEKPKKEEAPKEAVEKEDEEKKKKKEKPKGPKFTKEPEPVSVTEGETFKLTCQIEEEAEVTWFKDTNKIKPKKKGDKKYKVDWDMDSDVYYLQVADATAEDAGEYKVSAKSAKGTTVVKVTVTVEKKKVAPQIKGRLLPVNVEVGEGFKLSCKVTGYPEPKVTWSKNKEVISEKDSHYKITFKDSTSTLKVKESVIDDSAEYTLTATNDAGSTSQSVTVTIKPKPQPVEEQIEKVEETPVEEKPKLKPPEFVARPDDIKVTECTELRILVTVKGSSDISVVWFMNGKPIKPNDHIKVSQDGDNYILSVPKCSLSDAGEYTCTAKDAGGESFCSVNVTVEESAEKRAEEEAHRELMEQLSPKIKEEKTKIKESDMDMLLKEFAMLGAYTDSDKKVHLSKGDVVEVLDTEKKTEWLVRKQAEKEKVCYVPVELLLGKKPGEEQVAEDEESSAEDEEGTEPAKPYPSYTAIMDYNPSPENKDHLSLKEGELVDVMDSSSTDRWWCRRNSKPTEEGWVPPGYLVSQTEEKLDTRTTQEVFREDVIKVSNKEQEAVLKRRYALKDMWESERLYIDDLKYCLDTYYKVLTGPDVPEELKNKQDTIFSTLPDIKDFHYNKFLDELLMTTNDADSIAGAFLKHRDLFQLYVPYFKDRNVTTYLLGLDAPEKFLKDHNKKSGNVGEKRMTLLDFLHRPWTRIDEYVYLLKDFIKYTAHANQDYSKLEEAVEMLLDLKKQADDQQTLSRIEGYPGDVAELGPILRHDDFTVWDGEPVGKGRERHLFLFKENLMLTKRKKTEKAGSLPTYEFKGLIDLPKTLLNEELEDSKRFELCFEDLRRGKFTFQAKSVPVKITWCDLLRQWLRKWGKKPTVTKHLEKVNVREGDPAVFSAHIEGQPLPEVTWYYNDKPIKDDTNYRIIADLFDFSLTIHHTVPESSGKYSLKAKNKFGEEELSAELSVKEIINKPEFTAEMKNAEVLLGADARFDCKIKGRPAPDVKWYKGATEVKPGDRYKFLYPDDESYTLLIYKVEEGDLGTYECRAKNKGGKASQTAELIITDLEERKKECPPEFVSGLSDVIAVEGIQTNLVCRVVGYPAPEVTWYFNGKPIKRSDYYDYYFNGTECTLIIRIVHEEHMGKYTCKIKNKFGEQETTAELKVATRPKFTQRFSNLEVFRNEKAQFVAKYQGFPKPDVTWYFEKLPMADSERVKITETETESVLTIDLVMAMDEGEYSCKLANQAGEASCSAVLFVLKDIQSKDYEVSYAPTLVKKLSSQEAIIGAPAKFVVKALGEPVPTAKWYKNGKEITETDRIHLVQEENVYRLIFKKVEAADDGEYKCVISNKSGEVSSTAQLLTEEPKEPIRVEEEMKIELRELPPTLVVHKPDLVEVDFETIKLSWQKALMPKNAKPTTIKYAIDRKDISTLSGDWETIETGIEGLSMEIKNFNPEIDYLFRIRATNEYGSSDPSMAVSYYGKTKSDIKKKRRDSIEAKQPIVDIKKEPLPPKGPREKPQISEVGDDCLEISWQPGELPPHAIQTEILYIVERRNPPSKSWIEIASDVRDTKFIMKNYKPEKDYMFRVRASNDYGISDPSMSATHFAKPEIIRQDMIKQRKSEVDSKAKKKSEDAYKSKVKPRTIWDKPEISNLTEKTLTLKWKASGVPSYAVQTPIWYIVEQRQPPNLDWVKIATDVKETELHNVRINRSKDYYWRVKAANEFGVSEPSMPIMLKKKEEIEEVKEDTSRKRRRSRSYSREPADTGVPEHMRIPPEFLASPDENQYGVEGRTMRVIANIRAYPKPEVSWYMYGRKLQMGDRLTSSLTDKGELSLEIQQFCWSDVGEYKVEVRNDYGMAAQTIKVDMADPPTFLEPLHDQIFHLRSNSKLECRVHGIPYPAVTFKKDWRVIADSQRIKIVREEYDHWTLNIRNAIHLDEGLYECVAENIAGKVYCSANVKVTEKHGLWRDIKFNPCPVEDYFHVIDEIGRGSYGVVRRVIDKNSGNQYAAKILRYGDLMVKEELMTELEILAQLDHQNIIQVVDGYEDKKRLIIIMEIVTGGELLQRLIKEDTLTESEVAFYIRQLLQAVEYMHSKNVIHLDLKTENLYLSSPSSENLKVIDFSFARKYNPTRRLHVKYGTPEFVSPEVICEEPVTPAADLWSVGIITYILLSGISPFHRDTIRNTLLAVRAGEWKFDEEAFSNISPETKDFISQLIVLDPKKRMTATEALDHPFINFAHRRGLGDRIHLDRHKAFMFRRKWERGTSLVMTLVKPVPLSTYLIEQPPPEFEFEVDDQVPMLQLPGSDQPTTSGTTEGLHVELGAAGMLSLMGPPSMVSAAPSTVGSGGSSEWGREYEDEDTWYEFSSAYQTGVDTHLLPSRDTRMGVRMAGYRRTLGKSDPDMSPVAQSSFQPTRYRGSMKERQDLRDLEKEREESEEAEAHHLKHTRRGLWQVRRMIEIDKASEGFPPIFKEKIKDKAYNVGDSCTLRVHVIGNPPPILSWYRNEELLSTGGRVRISSSEEGIHSLTVLQTKPNDFGVYKCVARNKYGTVTCRARMLCGDHPSRPGRPHVTKVSDTEAFMIWEEPESDGNSHIQAYKVDWFKPGEQRWTTATYCIDECALIKGLKPDTSYRFRVSAINAFGISPYSWASVEVRTKKKGAEPIEIEEETKRILLRSRQATNRPSPESSPLSSPHGSMADLTEDDLDRKAKDHGVLDREIMLQEIEPERFLAFGSDVWRGRFTLVKNVKPKEGRKVRRVAKILCYDESNPDDSLREYEMLKGIRQQHIVRLYEAFLHNNFVYLIFEKLYGENVARSLSLKNKYNEHHVTSIIKQVLDALQFLHHIGIVHLNLQPDNVIMVSRRRFDIKLIDFGRARRITSFDGVKVPREGTADFMAPEKVAGELVGVAADIWGVGLLAFILLSGVSPFEGDVDEDTFANIIHVRYDAHTLYHNVTKYALKFIYQTLKRNPKARLTTEEALDHRWLMLNAPMVKVRKAAVFPTDKLRLFEENYIKRRMAGRAPPERLMNAYGIGLSFSSDEEGDDWFRNSSKY